MKRTVTVVLMLLFGASASYAQQNPVKMKYSGSELTTTYNLAGNMFSGEEKLAGDGTLGRFTYRALRADGDNVPITDACPQGNISVLKGAGIFRFDDGSLMTVNITGGAICIDANGLGHLTETYQVTGGTGRFRNATGELSLKGTLNVVLLDVTGQTPLLLTNIGMFDGTVLGVAEHQDHDSGANADNQ
ncbi:MAG TPA: hypothetical protein VKW78_01085 [Terriglobales bacterium]|nr:hypothetical protein [Terriglobales bacterium]